MELSRPADDDVLALPIRRRLFEALAERRRPATTQELAALVKRHPNTVRVQLRRLADAGLVQCRRGAQSRGRPRHEWTISPDANPGGQAPQAHGQLGRWLARAIGSGGSELAEVERVGREIGQELAPREEGGALIETMQAALAALGFQPQAQPAQTTVLYVLGNCPYRDAVRENQPVVCSLHRGITRGLLDELDPQARLTDFVARDPYAAGCLIEVGGISG